MTQARAEARLQNRRACPKNGHVPRIVKGMSAERACPKNVKEHVDAASTDARAETLLQNRRACPYVEVEPKLKGVSQERSCHKNKASLPADFGGFSDFWP